MEDRRPRRKGVRKGWKLCAENHSKPGPATPDGPKRSSCLQSPDGGAAPERRRSRKPLSLDKEGGAGPGGSSRKAWTLSTKRRKHKSRPAPDARGKDAPAASSHPSPAEASARPVIPAKAGTPGRKGAAGLPEIPASAGMTRPAQEARTPVHFVHFVRYRSVQQG